MSVIGALKEWHDFYVLVGTAGATLLALLFVAVSCGTGFLTRERQAAAALSIYLEKDFGLHALARALLLLAVINIRNAWDLTLTMVRQHRRVD